MGQEASSPIDDSVPPHTLRARSLSAVAEYIKGGQAKSIVVLTGAGISTAAGIPDFRSPKTGLYSNLKRLNLPHAEAVFDISYFREHPEPFYVLAKELYPGKFHPTISHVFIALLARKGLLKMLFTQNIDCLERRAGVPPEKIVEAHGSFATQRCIECKREFPDDKMRQHVNRGEVPHCPECGGYVKPDIVFFGEALPSAFERNSYLTATADLVLIMGTSLTVYPFAGAPEMARDGVPRLLLNLERVGRLGSRPDDVLHLGHCDDGVRQLADQLGWAEELDRLWRDIVGDEEAGRQLKSQNVHDQAVEEEVEKLAEGVDSALHLREAPNVADTTQSGDSGPDDSNRKEKSTMTAVSPAEARTSVPEDKGAGVGSGSEKPSLAADPGLANPSHGVAGTQAPANGLGETGAAKRHQRQREEDSAKAITLDLE